MMFPPRLQHCTHYYSNSYTVLIGTIATGLDLAVLLEFLSHLSFFPLCDLGLSFLAIAFFAPSPESTLSFIFL
ncbi:hypothetical protein ACN38_g831 [Penicillium nordicum]|uniref:Uncharacterized protein n=1 Tax=Penicillium nordicum TaxID=229535 RepID=A0A0M8PGM0_9EURO|nr:hypothetical protein ACN38_g831 [Penicillium nordicum]